MVISFDLDDVLAEFQRGWVQFNKLVYNEDYAYEDFTVFNYEIVMGIEKDEVYKRIFEFYHHESFEELEPVRGMLEITKKLVVSNELHVLTSRSSEIADITKRWISKLYPGVFKKIHFTGQISRNGFNHSVTKGDICQQIGAAFHIDDAAIHFKDIVAAGTQVIVYTRPWNRHVDVGKMPRIETPQELYLLLQK